MEFYKYQGTGNDFIMIDDRECLFDINDNALIASLCERRMGIGADGLIFLRDHDEHDFEMIYFNADGYQSSMCGNGGRCIIAFAHLLGIIDHTTTFMAIDGKHKGKFSTDVIALQMKDVSEVVELENGFVIDTGSPHYIQMVEDIDDVDVLKQGKEIRSSDPFRKDGINVNFVQKDRLFRVRTYERGVEAETLSCGTGVVAVAIAIHFSNYIQENLVEIETKGGLLSVDFEEFRGSYKNIWLRGDASMVFAGEFEC